MTVRELIAQLIEASGNDLDLPLAFDLNGEYHWSTLLYYRDEAEEDRDALDTCSVEIRIDTRYESGHPIEVEGYAERKPKPTGKKFLVVKID